MEINYDNYADWSARIKNYADWSARIKKSLLAQGLWDIIETTVEPPKPEDDIVEFETWRKRNNDALLAIQSSCGIDILSQINNISSAKIVWDKLDEMFKQPWQGIHPHTKTQSTRSANQIVEEESSSNPGRGMDIVLADSLKIAVRKGDWDTTRDKLNLHPHLLTARITLTGGTVLHVAVAAQKENIVQNLVDMMSEYDLAIQDNKGYTALHETTHGGNSHMAECLFRKNNSLISIRSTVSKDLPVVMAMRYGHKQLASCLYTRTPLGDLEAEQGRQGSVLLTYAIYARHFDIALDLMVRCPHLAFGLHQENLSPLNALATFQIRTENRISISKRWIYHYVMQYIPLWANHSTVALERSREIESENGHFKDLLSRICTEIPTFNPSVDRIIAPAIFCAISRGNFEFVFHIVEANPEFLWIRNREGMSIFRYAVLHRQAKIFSLIYKLKGMEAQLAERDNSGRTILHLAGMLPEHMTPVDQIAGPVSQMKIEVIWFQEVERICQPMSKELLNNEGLSPRQVFTMTHKKLREDAERCVKEIATSGLVVATLIITVMFTAAFTYPGGNDDETGWPILLKNAQFMNFMAAVSFSLFCSSVSVWMFLKILASNYPEEDFLRSLSLKMTIGFLSLSTSIQAMTLSFCSALGLLLPGNWSIFLPLISACMILNIYTLKFIPLRGMKDVVASSIPTNFDKNMKPLLQ